MTEMSLEQGLRDRLRVIDIPLDLQRGFASLVLKWYRASGVEWTIKRLKSLKVDLYRRKAFLPPLTWVRKNRRGDLAGLLGGLFRYSSKSDKNFRKVVQSLMCYTIFQYSKPTVSQVKKFTSALRAAPPSLGKDMDPFYERISLKFDGVKVDRSEDVSLLLYRGSPSKRKPSSRGKSVPQDSNIRKDAELLLEQHWGRCLTNEFQTLFGPVFKGMVLNPITTPFGIGEEVVSDPLQVLGGRIAFLQEPGGKLRSVASPFLAYQLALRHFGKAVYSLARRLPWDCTHDQSQPVSTLQGHLREGRVVHSVDLSSATDYFPLEVQVKMMRAIFGNIPDIRLFETLSRSTWLSPVGPICWRRGQPLGLYPSFAVFTTSHGLLLWCLSGFKWQKKFYVLGDDVVILDDELYHRYLDILQTMGCPYSPDKSLSSHRICEFAGKVITSESVTPQYKWREMSNDNFIDIARQLGHRSRHLLTRRQRAVFDKIEHCTLPLGLNFSYPGSNLLKMERLTQQTFGNVDKKVLDSLVDQAKVIWKNLYGSPYSPSKMMASPTSADLPRVLDVIMTFDEKVRSVLQKCLTWFREKPLDSEYFTQDPKLYSGVPGGLSLTDLPPASLQPSRLTTLDRYEKLLSL